MPDSWVGEPVVAYSIGHLPASRGRLFISLTLLLLQISNARSRNAEAQCGKERLLFKHFSHFLRALSQLFLKFANQLVILAFSVGEVVVGQLSVLLLELAFDFIPGALELEFVHINCSGLGGTVGCN